MLRGRRWRVEESTRFSDCHSLRLTTDSLPGSARTFLLPFDRPRSLDAAAGTVKVMRPAHWLRAFRQASLDARPFGCVSGAVASGIDLLPYQLEPALAMLRHGCVRVLIADAVGLGKTIQAALIIRELSIERESFRALVVTPAGLRAQWAAELSSRFSINAEIVTAAWLARAVREVPADVRPWSLPGVYLCSFEFIRRPEVLRPLEDVAWDLLVVDEAHAATPASARRAAVHAVALRSRRVVLLTATPHGGDDEHFRSLCRIGRSDERPEPLMVFCRSRSDVGTPARRRSVLLPVRLSESERRMHRLLERYTACVFSETNTAGTGHARLAAIVLRKRALSSAASLAVSCRRRLALLTASPEIQQAEQLSLPLDDEDLIEDREPDSVLGTTGLADGLQEQRWLHRIIDAADEAAAQESKIALLGRLLRRIREPVIVFTEFRDTLARLQRSIRDTARDVCTLHGGMTPGERMAAEEQFNRGGSLLLATDAAAEGLNLHARCRAVVHFELPWSPCRLEQRTGRVNRIGQSRVVHEIMLVAADTAERLVLAPLASRAARASRTGSNGFSLLDTLSESRVASAVMEGTPVQSTPVAFDAGTILPAASIREESGLEAARLRDIRRTMAGKGRKCAGAARVAAAILPAKRQTLPPGLIRVYDLALSSRDGTIVHSELVVLHERVDPGHLVSGTGVRHFMMAAAADTTPAENAIPVLLHERIEGVIRSCRRASEALADREQIISLPVASAARQLVQGGLFSRRAVRASRERERVAESILEEAGQRIAALKARTSLTPRVTLAAILLVEDH